MPEAVLEQPVVTESLGWRAGLPDTLKTNETFASFKTVGEFGQSYLDQGAKLKDIESKLADSVPKLPDDASEEDRNLYFDALGRPKQASEYEFDGEDKNAPEWTNLWKSEFHKLGLTKTQAKTLSTSFNGQIQKMVDAHNNEFKAEMTTAESKLRTELGDKYDTNVELAKRLWQKHGEGEFDKVFAAESNSNRYTMIRYLLKMAALTGEDTSPQSGHTPNVATSEPGFRYDKSPTPPMR